MKRWHLTVALGLAGLASLALAAGSKGGADAEFSMMDTDHDGKVSADEHAAGAKRMFDTMDANHDGKVTAREHASAAEREAAHEKITGEKAGARDLGSAEKIRMVDRNGDGVLTAKEHRKASRAMFRKMDTDKDGSLSKAEFEAGHAALKKQ